MHEATLAAQILQILSNAVPADCGPIRTVTVTIGELSGVMIDSLQFAFDALKKETRFAGAAMRFENQAVVAVCEDCGSEYRPAGFPFICPSCKSDAFRLVHGEEVFVKNVEVEKNEPD